MTKQSKETKKGCGLCEYIKKSGFPFKNDRGKFYIDTEGCHPVDEVEIFYCPVCVKKL